MPNSSKILLVEDDVNDAELCLKAFTLVNLPNCLDVVRDGVEAMEYLRCEGAYKDRISGNPLFIMLDLKMPRKDGLEVIKEIRTNKKLKLIPIVVLTSSKQERDIVTSYSLGVNAYVVKPVDFMKFLDVVKEIGMFWAVINQPPIEG